MKYVRGVLATVVLVVLAETADATTQLTDKTIVDLSVYPDRAVLHVSPSFTDGESCSQSSSGYVTIALDSDNGRAMLAAALAAAHANKLVGFGLGGCDVHGVHALVYRIDTSL